MWSLGAEKPVLPALSSVVKQKAGSHHLLVWWGRLALETLPGHLISTSHRLCFRSFESKPQLVIDYDISIP